MKNNVILPALLFLLAHSAQAQIPRPSSGQIRHFEKFPSEYVVPRNVDVWLPDNYDSTKRYAVLYMHDGQMLFDAANNWNHQEWGVDETITGMLQAGTIRDCIVVGIWNTARLRHQEYFPQKPFETLSAREKDIIRKGANEANPDPNASFAAQSDAYLKFLVTELKPFIDSHFSTERNRKSTFIGGSSMGALVSIYAICEYPMVFGGVICMSTHWPGIFRNDNNPFPEAMLAYLEKHLPDPDKHKIYFDHGSEGLDSLYKPMQLKVDALMKSREKVFNVNRISMEFQGDDHSEKAWARRLRATLDFVIGKFSSGEYDGNPIIWDGEQYWGNVKKVVTNSHFLNDNSLNPGLKTRQSVICFNKLWQVSEVFTVGDSDTSTLPVPIYNQFGMPMLATWLKKDGTLNGFLINEFSDGRLSKVSDMSGLGGLSSETEISYHGDTTISVKLYYNTETKSLDSKNVEKTIEVRQKGNRISIKTMHNLDITWSLWIDYQKFDKYGNWTEATMRGVMMGKDIELLAVRTFEYYE